MATKVCYFTFPIFSQSFFLLEISREFGCIKCSKMLKFISFSFLPMQTRRYLFFSWLSIVYGGWCPNCFIRFLWFWKSKDVRTTDWLRRIALEYRLYFKQDQEILLVRRVCAYKFLQFFFSESFASLPIAYMNHQRSQFYRNPFNLQLSYGTSINLLQTN